ncbi:MAG: histidine triad nucleotide-binding protein [Thermodesulfobacteriota bacterium]
MTGMTDEARVTPAREKDCTFCRIVAGELPADFIYRGDSLVVFKDIRPSAPIHLLVVPTRHIRSVNDLAEEDREIVSEMIFRAREIARENSFAGPGYKLLFNVERGGGQDVFHLHMHLLARGR